MPPLGAWIRTLTSMSFIVGVGVLGLNYLTPTDEQFINSLSPELRERYEKEKAGREAFEKRMALEMSKHQDNPAFLKGYEAMNSFDRQVATDVLKKMEIEKQTEEQSAERRRLQELSKLEKK